MADDQMNTKAKLRWPLASLLSFANWNMDFYPRRGRSGWVFSQSSESIVKDMRAAMAAWRSLDVSADGSIDYALDLAKASLEEVKAQTEYQDQKATRLLTITSFLSALSGALF